MGDYFLYDDFHNPLSIGFGLDKAGEEVLLSYLPGNSQDRVVDYVRFKGEENFISLGRYPDGGDYWLHQSPSRDLPNNTGILGIVIDSPIGRAIARRVEGPQAIPEDLEQLVKKVELLELEVDDLNRNVDQLKEENVFMQRLLEDPETRPTLPPPQGT